jgi:hypothetical protein
MILSRVPKGCRGCTRPSRVTNGRRPTSYEVKTNPQPSPQVSSADLHLVETTFKC